MEQLNYIISNSEYKAKQKCFVGGKTRVAINKRKEKAKCINCGSTERIEWHHIVPLRHGGTNEQSNIVPLCIECHDKAHTKKIRVKESTGRKRIVESEAFEEVYQKWFKLEIGTSEASEMLGLSNKTFGQYRKRHEESLGVRLPWSHNCIDISNSKKEYYDNCRGGQK